MYIEVRLPLDGAQTLIWNPTTWHATEVQSSETRRRVIGWNYGVFGGAFGPFHPGP